MKLREILNFFDNEESLVFKLGNVEINKEEAIYYDILKIDLDNKIIFLGKSVIIPKASYRGLCATSHFDFNKFKYNMRKMGVSLSGIVKNGYNIYIHNDKARIYDSTLVKIWLGINHYFSPEIDYKSFKIMILQENYEEIAKWIE